tara:strand:+ start:1128 stop:2348 length:1221 start_codon:yes stop_codon:yes gene_type:complete
MKADSIIIFVLFVSVLSLQIFHHIDIGSLSQAQPAGIFFTQSITEREITDIYRNTPTTARRVKILIVPGHDKESPGAEYMGNYESDVNLQLGKKIFEIFSKDPYFSAILARDENGYTPALIQTFADKDSIISFRNTYKKYMESLISAGLISTRQEVFHNSAGDGTLVKLYGINKWANENDIDIVLHIHFNDYPGHRYNRPGKYSGFSIYIPERQFSNSFVSNQISKYIYESLSNSFPVSNYAKESAGIVEDQELIAIGSFNTLDAAAFLIEYGYIYEPQVRDSNVRDVALDEYANGTYIGIKNYFENKFGRSRLENKPVFQDILDSNLSASRNPSSDVFILQTVMQYDGVYPPDGYTRNDCPPTGIFGPCTNASVIEFQKKYNISPATGFVGPKTRTKINELIKES